MKVDQLYPDYIDEKKRPNLADLEDHIFTRADVFDLYSKFKSLSKIAYEKNRKLFSDKEVGLDFETLRTGLDICRVFNKGLLRKIFETLDKRPGSDEGKGFLTWQEFFEAIKLISGNDVEERFNSFIKVVDENGDGSFSFDEIKDICKLCMEEL